MARLTYLTQDQLPVHERQLFDEIHARFGRLNNIFRVLAHHPVLLRQVIECGVALRHETRLNSVLRELAILTVGRLTRCAYESTHHGALALRIGVRPEQIERLAAWERDPAFTAQERAVIRYAAEATQQVAVAAATFEALRGFLDEQQLLELVLNVAFYNMIVRVLGPLEVELEPDAHENRYRLDHQPQAPGHDE
jgi:4-carboxymuconolactone decarboxylase